VKILVTGAAGFVGASVCIALLNRGDEVIGLDNLSDYYDVTLKQARLDRVAQMAIDGGASFSFVKLDLADRKSMEELFSNHEFDQVVHLGAQPGVRYSIENPHAYIDSNIVGFLNVLEGCRHQKTGHLVYASSSSVYGANESMPFSVEDNVDHPLSLYAATKKADELMAYSYSHLYQLPTTGLRIFTVYGPWGRPDMAPFLFTKAILSGETIDVFNHGRHRRDFTYIDDVVEGIIRTLEKPPLAVPDPFQGSAPESPASVPWRVYNLGSNNPVKLMDFIQALENELGVQAAKNMLPMQPGDVPETFADMQSFVSEIGFQPGTELKDGVAEFVRWYKWFYPS
jgi:UDP-glucuronate 4-epimerase